jgi:hypothetical protein
MVGHTRQGIPNTRTTTFVLRGAFDLESCAGDSPPGECQSDSGAPQVHRRHTKSVLETTKTHSSALEAPAGQSEKGYSRSVEVESANSMGQAMARRPWSFRRPRQGR